MKLTSPAFDNDGHIPKKYSREGEDVSPPLQWADAPPGVKEYALICDDPDAPRPQPWVHWVVAKIPSDTNEFPEGSVRGVEGRNDFDENGYGGPMPPPGHGTHHYHFVLYALGEQLQVEPGATKEALEKALANHVLAKAELVGTYER